MNNGKTILAFIRHGEYQQLENTPSASQPYGLTLEGSRQSVEAGIELRKFAQHQQLRIYPTLYSSNLLRAWQTIQLVGQQLGIDSQIETSDKLNERSVGAVANLSVTEIETLLEQDPRYQKPDFNWKSNSHYCLPFDGAESLMDAGERVANYLTDLIETVSNNNIKDTMVIVAAHGASFRHAAHKMGILEFEQIAQLSMHYAKPIYFQFDKQQSTWQKIAGEWKQRSKKIKENVD